LILIPEFKEGAEKCTEVDNLDVDRLKVYKRHHHGSTVNLIVTLGGDGTILYAARMFAQGPCPPLVSFGVGSLGYLANFEIDNFTLVLNTVFAYSKDGPTDDEGKVARIFYKDRIMMNLGEDIEKDFTSSLFPEKTRKVVIKNLHAFNELTIERGACTFLTNIECYVNGHYLTQIQANGAIVSTPTGSTAYNMSAGGSIVHNDVKAMLLTPICPHSLSFRPVIFPDTSVITLKVSENQRAESVYCSVDGDFTFSLNKGEELNIEGSTCPVPLVYLDGDGGDEEMEAWCNRLVNLLYFNKRKD
jgi:NAD kinase